VRTRDDDGDDDGRVRPADNTTKPSKRKRSECSFLYPPPQHTATRKATRGHKTSKKASRSGKPKGPLPVRSRVRKRRRSHGRRSGGAKAKHPVRGPAAGSGVASWFCAWRAEWRGEWREWPRGVWAAGQGAPQSLVLNPSRVCVCRLCPSPSAFASPRNRPIE
jgi:hypothetical protein